MGRLHLDLFTGFRVEVTGPVEQLAELRALLPSPPGRSVSSQDARQASVAIDVSTEASDPATYRIAEDGRLRWAGLQADEVAPLLEWALGQAAVEWLGERHLLFHAGAVALRDQGILLPAISGTGKSTLTAALLAEGFSLCSDEIGVLDLPARLLVPFPRSLRVRKGSHAVLAARYPKLFDGAVSYDWGDEATWYLRPPAESWVTSATPVRAIVFPRYLPGAETRLEPIGRSAALPMLLDHALSARRLRRLGVEQAVAVLQRADCYTLTIGDDLTPAIALLRGLCA